MGEKESSIYIREREALFVVVRLPRARPSPSLGMMSSRWMTKEGRPVDDSNVSRAHQLPHSSTPSSSLSLSSFHKKKDDINVTIIYYHLNYIINLRNQSSTLSTSLSISQRGQVIGFYKERKKEGALS